MARRGKGGGGHSVAARQRGTGGGGQPAGRRSSLGRHTPQPSETPSLTTSQEPTWKYYRILSNTKHDPYTHTI